jgi:hypothetical protein
MRTQLALFGLGMTLAASGCGLLNTNTTTSTSTGDGGSTSSSGSTGVGGATADGCNGVPTEGQCVGTDKIQSCFVSEEGGTPPQILTTTCGPQQACQMVNGSAACKPTGACFNGATTCKDSATMKECVNGAWVETVCGGADSCIAQPGAGASCGLQDPGSGITLKGHVDYEFHVVNQGLTDFDPAVQSEGAVDMFVTVFDNNNLIGMGLTSVGGGNTKPGDWQVNLSSAPTDKTFVYFWPMLFDDNGNPRMALAHAQSSMVQTQASDKYWNFGFGPVCPSGACNTTDMGTQLITEADGSGAVHIYQWIDYGMFRASGFIPSVQPLTMAVFWEPGNDFDCGNCFAPPQMGGAAVTFDAANALVDHYDSSINISGSVDTPSHWARTTISHELGHWITQSYSKSPGEGGQHFVDQASKPGLAFSEGWATFSGQTNLSNSPADNQPIAFRKSHGTSFWVDIAKVNWSGGAIDLPDPNGPIDQLINENVVTAMMWSLWASAGPEAPQGLGDDPMFKVLPSQRLVGSTNRGYVKVDFIDYLDALTCEGLATTAQIDAVAAPVNYPYDNQAVCQ